MGLKTGGPVYVHTSHCTHVKSHLTLRKRVDPCGWWCWMTVHQQGVSRERERQGKLPNPSASTTPSKHNSLFIFLCTCIYWCTGWGLQCVPRTSTGPQQLYWNRSFCSRAWLYGPGEQGSAIHTQKFLWSHQVWGISNTFILWGKLFENWKLHIAYCIYPKGKILLLQEHCQLPQFKVSSKRLSHTTMVTHPSTNQTCRCLTWFY